MTFGHSAITFDKGCNITYDKMEAYFSLAVNERCLNYNHDFLSFFIILVLMFCVIVYRYESDNFVDVLHVTKKKADGNP